MVKAETAEGNVQVNHYDAEGLRSEIEENGKLVQFLYSGQEVVAETKEDESVIRHIRGYSLISSDSEKAKTYYHYASDELGSITHIVNEEQEILNQYEYDAFGNVISSKEQIENRFRFCGEQYDHVTGQYYLRARYYNPVIARFTQEDTYRGDGLNLYAYCANNPVRYFDPSGNDKTDVNNKYSGDQKALKDLVDEVNERGGATPDEIRILNEWANEYGVPTKDLDIKKQLLLPGPVDVPKPDVPSSRSSQGGESSIRLNELRNALPDKYQKLDKMGNKVGNVAYSTSEIAGYDIGDMKSFSQFGSTGKNGIKNPVDGWVSNVENPNYSNAVLPVNKKNQVDITDGYLRNNDTEYKIIENYNNILNGDYNAKGKITIVSEREVCPSCDNVIKSFSKDYKKIEIIVVDGNGRKYVVKNGIVQ
jgi:RHS repeat-associated protein